MKTILRRSLFTGVFLATLAIMFGAHSAWAQQGEDPLVSFHFALEIDGELAGYFTGVEGIGSENEVIENRIPNPLTGETITQKLPGRLIWTDIVLKRGITSNSDIWDWRRLVESGQIGEARTNAAIIMFDLESTEITRWNLLNAWPSKINAPDDASGDASVAVETLTIVHEGYERVQQQAD